MNYAMRFPLTISRLFQSSHIYIFRKDNFIIISYTLAALPTSPSHVQMNHDIKLCINVGKKLYPMTIKIL